MRKITFLFLLMAGAMVAKAQKIEQYCEMVAMQKLLSRKVTIDIDYGEERKLFSFKDTRVRDDLGKVKSFNSVVDAMNYLGRIGWQLVNAFPVADNTSSTGMVYHYVFKRAFDPSELTEESSK